MRRGRTAPFALTGFMLLNSLSFDAVRCAAADVQSPPVGAWEYLQKAFYGETEIRVVDTDLMSLEVPASTPDPAATPLTLRFGAATLGRIKQIRVIIDNNPSPLVATFDIAPGAHLAQLGLRVRIDRFTSVRAIAALTDGTLEMRSSWVNASGGCSAPPSVSAAGHLGEIRFRPGADAKSIQIGVRHPNSSGFQIDPRSGDPIPPHYVAHIRFAAGGKPVMEADTGISLSENPTLNLATDGTWPLPLSVEITDSKAAHFTAGWDGNT